MNTKILAEVFSETDLTYIQQLDERQRRLYCATRAINIGKHGVADVCASIHISKNSHDTAEFVCDNIARIWKNMLAGKQMKLRHPRGWLLLPPSILRNTKLKERLTNHMYPKDKSESDLINNCLSGTMSLGANLLSIFVPSYFLTVT